MRWAQLPSIEYRNGENASHRSSNPGRRSRTSKTGGPLTLHPLGGAPSVSVVDDLSMPDSQLHAFACFRVLVDQAVEAHDGGVAKARRRGSCGAAPSSHARPPQRKVGEGHPVASDALPACTGPQPTSMKSAARRRDHPIVRRTALGPGRSAAASFDPRIPLRCARVLVGRRGLPLKGECIGQASTRSGALALKRRATPLRRRPPDGVPRVARPSRGYGGGYSTARMPGSRSARPAGIAPSGSAARADLTLKDSPGIAP
jgi:hypothetical protein